jgi:hypothetical protein
MPNSRQEALMRMGLDELFEALISPEPGSTNHELTKALIQARIAEIQREGARDSLRWARLSALATAGATLIALAAILISVL